TGNRQNVLPNVWANTVGARAGAAWSFAVEPQAVVVNLGSNDFLKDDHLGQAEFTTAYSAFLGTLRARYPSALVLCALGPTLWGAGLANARTYLTAVVKDANAKGDRKVKLLDFGSQDASKGTGCDWHPNVAEHERMADILVKELRASLDW